MRGVMRSVTVKGTGHEVCDSVKGTGHEGCHEECDCKRYGS